MSKLDEPANTETFCAWCGRFRNPDGTWAEPTSHRMRHRASHGICPSCVTLLEDETSSN